MKKLFILAAALCTVMLSCTEGEEPAETPTPTPTPIPTPEAQVKIPINLSVGGHTRANDISFEAGDKVGLYVVNYDGENAGELTATNNHVNNMQFTYDNGAWTPASNIYWKDETTHADFYVYYPYMTEEQLATNEFSVKTDQSDEANYWASDFLWGKATNVAPTEVPVSVTTNHVLSNVLVYIKAGDGFTQETLAEATKSVTINNVKATATINISNGKVEATGESTTITPWNTGEYFRAMVVPQVIEDGTSLITVVVEDTEYTLTTGATFEANKQHIYTITARRTSGGIDIGIGGWETDEDTYGVSTVCGTGYAGQKMGTFSEAEISPYYVVADKKGNLFCSSRNQAAINSGGSDNHSFIRVDMVNREVSMLSNGCVPNSPACDLNTGIVSVPTEAYTGSFIEFNPIEMWAPRFRQFTWDPNNSDVPPHPWKHCMVVNPADGMIYTRFYYGHIVKIDPVTYESEFVCKTGNFDTYGMCFRPDEPNVLYFTGCEYHRIYKLDMNKPREEWKEEVFAGGATSGSRDGALSEALFNRPAQMCCDAEGNIYVADEYNHCIRKISTDNIVETVLGTPGTPGYQDGDVETALLKRPRGVTVDDKYLYIADYGNARIRKVTLEALK